MRVAVLIPCYNEEAAIEAVIHGFRAALPEATIYVFDNNSADATSTLAKAAGAVVRHVGEPGKGSVVRRMFADVDADAYVLVDGDNTYDASSAPGMLQMLAGHGHDMVVGARISDAKAAYRRGHQFGNRLLTNVTARIFGQSSTDMLSGFRIFSRRFVKSFPAMSSGFEIETELTVHALQLRMPMIEVATPYAARPPGSFSKLNTYRDGARILLTIFRLFKAERPFLFFSIGFGTCFCMSVVLALPVIDTYLSTGLVPRLPTALLCAAIMLFGTILLACGLILETVTLGRLEQKRGLYLAHPGPLAGTDSSSRAA